MIALIPVTCYIVLQIPQVQTYVAKEAVNYLRPKIKGDISINRISIVFFNRVMIKDAHIIGGKNDTLVCFKKLSVSISPTALIRKKIKANRVIIENGSFTFAKEGEHGETNLSRIFNIQNKKKSGGAKIPDMQIAEIRLKDFDFNYSNPLGHKSYDDPDCMDYTDIQVKGINAKINQAKTISNVLTCRIQDLSAKEQCGIEIKSLKCDFTLGPKESRMDNMRLIENYSEVAAKYLSFKYESSKDLSDFIHKVMMSADFTHSTVSFQTITKFTPSLKRSRLTLVLDGKVEGTVDDLRTQDLTVSSVSGKTSVRLSTVFKGLPTIDDVRFTANIMESQTEAADLAEVIASYSGSRPNGKITAFAPGIRFHYNCNAEGGFKNLKIKGEMDSPCGSVRHNIHMVNGGSIHGITLKGDVSTTDIDLGRILNSGSLGKLTLATSAKAILRDDAHGGNEIIIDSVRVSRLGLMDYDYSDIYAIGNLANNSFDGRVLCHDPNLNFLFQGIVKLPDNTPESKFDFYLDIPFADLTALHIDKKRIVSNVSLKALADIVIDEKQSILGKMEIKDLSFNNQNGDYTVSSIKLNSHLKTDNFNLQITSPFLTADYLSQDSPTYFFSRLTNLVFFDQFRDVFPKKEKENDAFDDNTPGNGYLSLKTIHMQPICDILSPGMYIADDSMLSIYLTKDDSLDIAFDSQRIALKNNFAKDLKMKMSNADSLVTCQLSSTNMNIAGMKLDSNLINIDIEDGIINFSYLFCNKGDEKNELEFSSDIFFSRDDQSKLQTNIYVNESELFIAGHKWNFSPADIIIGNKMYSLDGFRLYNDDQDISIDGIVSENPADTITINLNHFDISIINSFVKNDFNIQGMFTGKMMANDLFGKPGILMDINGEDVYLFDNEVGILNLMSKWDKTNERMNLRINNKFRNHNPLNIIGYYHPGRKYLYANASLEDFALTYINPFLKDIVNITDGSISGDITLMGPIDNLAIISSNSRFDHLAFSPVFTRVPYIMNGGINFTQAGITFNDIEINDRAGQKAILSGGIRHNFFKDMNMDMKLSFNKFECLNTTEKDNTTFYGTASGDGLVTLTGPINDLLIDATFATGENTAIHVPLSGSSSASNKELLTFTNTTASIKLDPYDSLLTINSKKSLTKKSNVKVQAKANIASDAEIVVEINKQMGDILKCKGSGVVDIIVNPAKDILDLRGEYRLGEGNYHLVLLGVIAKDFLIKEGGTISFNGGIMNTALDIGAEYRTKASISTLISDTTSVGSRRTVDCGINLKGSLANPEIGFTIDIPDLDPITKGRVESALSTNAKIQKQFMALMISGSFVPDVQSGIVNNSTMLYSNASEILSNQFNNVFRQLGIPLDLGLNYQPGQGKKDIFDVAVSYQAFNNRLILNGSVGNSQTSTNWAGNFDAEVKMDKRGKFRFTLFTRAADQYTNYLDNTQRSGFGFTFQDEFSSFKEIFMSRKRREAYEMDKLLKAEEEIKKEAEKMKIKKEEINKPIEDPYKLNETVAGEVHF